VTVLAPRLTAAARGFLLDNERMFVRVEDVFAARFVGVGTFAGVDVRPLHFE